jgi:hypothetical protein
VLWHQVDAAIRRYIPTAEGQRHLRLLTYCRFLRLHGDRFGGCLTRLFEVWYCRAYANIRTKDYDTNWKEFLMALPEAPAVEFTPVVPDHGNIEDKLHAILWQSQQFNHDRRAYIKQTRVAEVLGCTVRHVKRLFKRLEREDKIFDKKQGCKASAECNSYQVRKP